jgi:hypothetical protein
MYGHDRVCDRRFALRTKSPGKAVGLSVVGAAAEADNGEEDPRWDAFVTAMVRLCPVQEGRSRFADKPALFVDGREIAHLEAPGVVDLRVTHSGWSRARADFSDDPAVVRDRSRRDWLELVLQSAADVDRLTSLLAIAVASNRH